jgi:diguanylate cyclase (GGDEF)-like protein/PAS domain S-box-containing protein
VLDNKQQNNLRSLGASAARIAVYYGIFGVAWILFSDWLVLIVADDHEAVHSLQRIKGLLFVGLSVALIFLLIFHENRKSRAAIDALWDERRRLAGILEGTRAGTWEWHVPSGKTTFNERWAEIIGYTLEELSPISIETWINLAHPDDMRRSNELIDRHFAGELDYYECECRMWHKEGRWIWVLDRGRLLTRTPDGRPELMLGTHIDITLRKKYEFEITRMSRLYATLSETNEAIVRVAEQQDLFQTICDIAVEHGGFSLAWIGLPDTDKQCIEVVASSGETAYLEGLNITLDSERSESHGPTAQAYLYGERRVVNDFENDQMTRPWHERAKQYNIHASAAFPLRQNDRIFGVLNIYASEANFFQEKEIALLDEMAADIGFGVENYRRVLELAASENRFHAIADGIQDAIVMTNSEREIQWLNPGFEQIFGYRLPEVLGEKTQILYESNEEYLRQGRQRYNVNANVGKEYYEVRYKRKNGEVFIGETLGTVLRSEDGQLLGYVALIRDVTERRATDEQLRIAAVAFEMENGIMITDSDLRIKQVNNAFTRITGYEPAEVIGKTPRLLQSGKHDKAFYRKMWGEIKEQGYWEGEIWNRSKNGDNYPEWLTISVVKNNDDDVTHYVASFTDMSERKEAEQHIHQLAFYDPLTHLANRRLFIERIEHARQTSQRSKQHGGLLMLDLDHFKVLNDTQGHYAGDKLLYEVGQRLRQHVREADTVARFGGDEFVVLLEDLNIEKDIAVNLASAIAEKIQAELQLPYKLTDRYDYRITPSIGVVLFQGENTSVEDLLKQVDVALYEAKAAGRNTIRFFNPEMQARVEKRAYLESSLSKALDNHEFLLHYQPQVDRNGRLLGAEALLRWAPQDSDNLVPPADFIPLAEDTGQIVQIGYWILETACHQLKQWQQRLADDTFNLAVNISARQFHQEDFIIRLQEMIHKNDINPRGLKLELTESVILDDISYVIERLRDLKKLGIGTAMDDFGTGYSSLSYLKQLPIEQLKIDTSFIRDINNSNDDSAIVHAIIAMGHSLGLQIAAEGVETEEQRAYLEKYECDIYQGYLFGEAMPVDKFELQFGLSGQREA